MKILVISSFLPFPLYSGGHIRLFNILEGLSKSHEITLVCEKRSYQTGEDVDWVKKWCKEVFVFDRKKQWSFANIAKAGISSSPFLVVGHTNKNMRLKIEMLLKENTFDLIHAETFYIMQNIPATSVPIVLVEHNVEYSVYKRFMDNTPLFIRPVLLIDIVKLTIWEKRMWKKAAALAFVSKYDKAVSGEDKAFIVPNGVDPKKFLMQSTEQKINRKEKRLLFIGDFRWVQNRDAVNWIINDIWPRIKAQMDDAVLWIVGKNIPPKLKSITSDLSVLFDENAPRKTEEIFKQAALLLAPIRVGGGTGYKILEAMASGVVVITTTRGAQGLDVENNKEVIIADDAVDLANSAIQILQDVKHYEAIATKAREKVENIYNWEKIVAELEQVYASVIHA